MPAGNAAVMRSVSSGPPDAPATWAATRSSKPAAGGHEHDAGLGAELARAERERPDETRARACRAGEAAAGMTTTG